MELDAQQAGNRRQFVLSKVLSKFLSSSWSSSMINTMRSCIHVVNVQECKPRNQSAFEIFFTISMIDMLRSKVKVYQMLTHNCLTECKPRNLSAFGIFFTVSCLSALTMDLSVSITGHKHKLDRILESTNLDKYELIDLPMEQPGDSSHEHVGVRKAPILV